MATMENEGGPRADVVSDSAAKLWKTYQKASTTLGEGFAKLGFLDLAMYGQQSTGKSSLLSALCNLQLPASEGMTTRCPIRIISAESHTGVTVEWRGHAAEKLPNELSTEKYKDIMNELCGGKEMTQEELRISIRGHPGQPPLNLVDLPGLIFDTGSEAPITGSKTTSAMVVDMVRNTLSGGQEGRAVLPIMTVSTQSDVNTLPTKLAKGKPFLAVLTHLDHLVNDKDKFLNMLKIRDHLLANNCVGFFMVSVKDFPEAPIEFYHNFCRKFSNNSAAKEQEYLESCGVHNLLKRIQELQLEHLMERRHDIMAKLEARKLALKPLLVDKTNEEIKDEILSTVDVIRSEIWTAHAEDKTTLSWTDVAVEKKYQISPQSKAILEAFAADAVLIVLKEVVDGWSHAPADSLADNSLLSNWQSQAWNLVAPGFYKVVEKTESYTVEMLGLLKLFVEWRAKKNFQAAGLAPAFGEFMNFWGDYASAKSAALHEEVVSIREEIQNSKLSIVGPWVYIAFEAKDDSIDRLEKNYRELVSRLKSSAPLSKLSAEWLADYSNSFEKEGSIAQRRTKLLAMFLAMQTVEGLCKRMMNITFARTYRVTQSSPSMPLASKNLSQAFKDYMRGREEAVIQRILPEREKNEADYAVLLELSQALDDYNSQAAAMNTRSAGKKKHGAEAAAENKPLRTPGAEAHEELGPRTPEPAERATGDHGMGNEAPRTKFEEMKAQREAKSRTMD